MLWLMGFLPIALLVLGFPFFLVLLSTATLAIVAVHQRAADRRSRRSCSAAIGNFALLAVPFFIFAGELMARGGMARRLVAVVMALFGGFRGSDADHHGGRGDALRRDLRLDRGDRRGARPDVLSAASQGRLQREILGRHHHLHRLHRQHHPAVDRDDPVLRGRRGVGDQAVRRRHHAGADAGRADVGLSVFLRARRRHPRHAAVPLGRIPDGLEGGRAGDRRAGADLRRALRRHVLADRGGRRRLRLYRVRHHVRSTARSAGASCGTSRSTRCISPRRFS